MKNLIDPWGRPNSHSETTLSCLLSEANGRPTPGKLADSDDPAELPGVPVNISAALDRLFRMFAAKPSPTWAQVAKAVPLDPGIDANLVETKAELALGRDFRFLRQVCDLPRLHLRSDEQKSHVSQVRRITPRTLQYLAGHSEDWHARTIRSVRPARLLAQTTEDDWALYENRTVTSLQKHIVRRLGLRTYEIAGLLSQLEAMDEPGDLARGSRFRRDRLSRLLSEAFDDPPSAEALRQLHERLRRMHLAVRQLGSSELLKKAIDFAPVRPPLRSTNIFRSDAVYRRVAGLWREWIEGAGEAPPSKREWLERRRGRIVAHRRIVLTLTVRALQEMHMLPRQSRALELGVEHPLNLERGWRLRCEATGLLRLEKHDRPLADIVPLALARRSLTLEEVQTAERVFTRSVPVLCVWLDGNDGGTLDGYERLPAVGQVSVSPQRLDSLEGVLRFVRDIIYREEWPILPIKVALPAQALLEAEERRLVRGEYLAQPMEEGVRDNLRKDITDAGRRVEELEANIEQVDLEIRRSPVGSRGAHFARERKHQLRDDMQYAHSRLLLLHSISLEMEKIEAVLHFSRQCPCCPEPSPADMVSVRFRCVSCRTEWGRRSDGVFISPSNSLPTAGDAHGWGADLIGVPP